MTYKYRQCIIRVRKHASFTKYERNERVRSKHRLTYARNTFSDRVFSFPYAGKLATYTQEPRQTDRPAAAGNGTDQLYPFFDYYVSRNITTTIGQSAFLHCRTENLNDKSVSDTCLLTHSLYSQTVVWWQFSFVHDTCLNRGFTRDMIIVEWAKTRDEHVL